jgi:cytochrome c oxidase subunit IV
MSTATDTHAHGTESHDSEHADGHFTDKQYIQIALILAALTAIEVSTYFVDFGPLFMPTLLILMTVKFVIVVSFFMHLKFDNKIFTWIFYTGLILAIGVYCAFLATFRFFMKS